MDAVAKHLLFHSSIVLIVGLLTGAPYARAIKREAPAHIIHSWRVAHDSLPIGAILMMAVASVMSHFAVSAGVKLMLAISLIASSYAFCFALVLAPLAGHRGLSSSGPLSAKLVYFGNVAGAALSLVAAALFVYASYQSL